jgi:hypothetical protein
MRYSKETKKRAEARVTPFTNQIPFEHKRIRSLSLPS